MKKLIRFAKLYFSNPFYCFVEWYDEIEGIMALSFIPIPIAIMGVFKRQLSIVPRKEIKIKIEG